MAQVKFDNAVGGDNSIVTDDADPNTGLANGGFWTRLVPMFQQIINVANYIKNTLVVNAANSATAAATSAASAANAPGTSATSATARTMALGALSFVLDQAGKLFSVGQTVTITSRGDPAGRWMSGVINGFAGTALNVTITNASGLGGTYSDWTIALSGPAGVTGVLNEMRSADFNVVGVIDCTTMTGNMAYLGASGSITGFNIATGAERTFVCNAAAIKLVYSNSLICPANVDLNLVAGDIFTVRAYGNGSVLVSSVTRKDGLPVRSTTGSQVFSANGTFNVPATATTVYVEVLGAGAGGAGGLASNGAAGVSTGGGGGGGFISKTFAAASLGASVAITVGAAGLGGSAGTAAGGATVNNPGSGGNGGASAFGTLTAIGGQGGGTYNTPNVNGGAGGGLAYAPYNGAAAGASAMYGGAGGGGSLGGDSMYGGAGGAGIVNGSPGIGGVSNGLAARAAAGVNNNAGNGTAGAAGAYMCGGAAGGSYTGSTLNNVIGGAGGAGGVGAGGGAGGHANCGTTNSSTGGVGGAGGRGEVRVYWW